MSFFFQCVRQLVPWLESADPAGHGQDHEGEPGAVRAARAHPEGAAAVQQRAHGAVPVLAQLRGAVLQPDHLVRGRHQRLPSHHPQDIRGQPHHQTHQRRHLHFQPQVDFYFSQNLSRLFSVSQTPSPPTTKISLKILY